MKVSIQWHGLTVEATVVIGDWEGDPSVPNGVHHLPAYTEDVAISDADGNDMGDYINKQGMDDIDEILLIEAANQGDRDE